MGKSEAINLMDMPSDVRFHIFKSLGFGEDNAWEYNNNDRILIVDLHKLFAMLMMMTKSKCPIFSPMFTWGWLTMSAFMHTWNLAQEIAMTDVS
jgi:hypothetical protein